MHNKHNEYRVGDLVWAKMGNYHYWPAKIKDSTSAQARAPRSEGFQWVQFFGTYDHAWIRENKIKLFRIHKNLFLESIKTAKYKIAYREIEEELKKQINDDYDEEMNNHREIEEITNKMKLSPKARKPNNKRSISTVMNNISQKRRKSTASEIGFISSEKPYIDFKTISTDLKNRDIDASNLRFGFLGVGIMGSGIIKNLIYTGHTVNVWTRNLEKFENFIIEEEYLSKVHTCGVVSDVVEYSDIIFVCVTDPTAVEEIVTGKHGFMYERTSLDGKGYVEMTGVDNITSSIISGLINDNGGRYLEAQMQGSKSEANDGTLCILAAGDRSLYDDCNSCFRAMAKSVYYLGNVGFATKMSLALHSMKGVALLALAEGLALADRAGIPLRDVVEVLNLTNFCSPYLKAKADMILSMTFERVEQPLQHMQKDMRLALQLADSVRQPLYLVSTANEIYKHARRLGYGTYDAASVYVRSRH